MSYNDTNCGHTGWGVGLSAIIGGALGYWAGRSSGPGGFGGCGCYGFPAGYAAATQNGRCTTCFQQGVESGQTLAGLNYIGQQVAANSRDIANSMVTLGNQINNQTAAIQARFDALNQQKIADQAAQIAALRTQNVVGLNAAATNAQLTSLNDKVSSIIAGCAVRSVNACPPNNCCGCSNQ